MARFIGYVQGQRGEASRLGSPSSGIEAEARGWNVGVKVTGHVNGDGADTFAVFVTGGSHNPSPRLIGTVRLDPEGRRPVFAVPTALGEAVV